MSFNLDLWKLLAGLGIFLFGMLLIEESVKALSGRAFRRIIRIYTNGRLRSIGSGALVTALLQSSSAVSLMVLAFVGAGVMNMQNAIGVIMGSNIGTTLTAWIIATIDKLYENIKLLHAEIFTFYSKIQTQKLNETEVKELERLIYASRNMMNSIKNFKGVRHNMDEFDGSDNEYLNTQYKLFRKRLVELYHNMSRILNMEDKEGQYRSLLTTFVQIEEADNRFIKNTLNAVDEQKIQEMEIASLLLVNRLFTQSCRMQIYSMKDLLLSQEQINNFDRALDTKEIMTRKRKKQRTDSERQKM